MKINSEDNKKNSIVHRYSVEEYQSLLEAVFLSTQDALSVVDENGKHIMINPAYTNVTGINAEEIIGKDANYDVKEGNSVHVRVLETHQPVHGERLIIKPSGKTVLAQAAPIIVNEKLIGSVAGLTDITEISMLTNKLHDARKQIRQLSAKYILDDIIGESEAIVECKNQAKKAAKFPVTVLLRGESGTGKELFAHAIHAQSSRKNARLIRVNCAAISPNLIESELFGYVEGAFSGAVKGGKKGLFEEADKGTIFLDEISEIDLNTQVKLLRVLQEKEITKVGSTMNIPIDVRVIAATNLNLEDAVKNGKFREDLYYRLNVFPIYIPPLRDRTKDIPLLVIEFIKRFNREYGRNILEIEDDALYELSKHEWLGNIRELENFIGRCIINMNFSDQIMKKKDLQLPAINKEKEADFVAEKIIEFCPLDDYLAKYEKKYLFNALSAVDNNKTELAKMLKISIRSLYYKLEKYNIK